jgi:hypothetical protein
VKRPTLDYETTTTSTPVPTAPGWSGCVLVLVFLAGVMVGMLLFYFSLMSHGMG